MRASKTWEKDHEQPEDGVKDFAEGDDDEEFRHIIVRFVIYDCLQLGSLPRHRLC